MADTPGLQGDFDRFEQHLVAGSELLRQSRIRDAQAQLLSALQVQPGNPRALALLGLAYFRGGQFDDGGGTTTGPRPVRGLGGGGTTIGGRPRRAS